MKKQLFAALLCVMMALSLLPVTALAANAASVWISGVELTAANPYYHNGTSGAAGTANNTETDYNAYYSTATGVLTLNGLTVTNSTATTTLTVEDGEAEFGYAIFADGDLTLRLSGTNTVSTADNQETTMLAVGINGNLTIEGSTGADSLTATAGAASSNVANAEDSADSVGVYVTGTLHVKSGALTGVGGAATSGNEPGVDGGRDPDFSDSVGVTAQSISVSGSGALEGTSGAAQGNFSGTQGVSAVSITVSGSGSMTGTVADCACTYSFGINASSVDVSDSGSVTGTGGSNATQQSVGVRAISDLNSGAGGTITVTGGSVSGTGGNTPTGSSDTVSSGITTDKSITVSSGSLAGTGGNVTITAAHGRSYGVFTLEDITVSGGTVTATGGTVAVTVPGGTTSGNNGNSCGIYAECDVSVSSGTVNATGGTVTVTDGIAGGNSGNSFGVSAGTASISGGTLNATGGTAAGNGADSFGLWYLGNSGVYDLTVSGGSLTATGGQAADDSYGVYAKAGDAHISGGELTAAGGTAVDRSYGFYAENENAVIRVSGGEFTAKATGTTAATKAALNKTLTRGIGVTAQGSTESSGSNPVNYADADNSTYLWVNVPNTPALTVAAAPAGSVYIGGTVTLTATPTNIATPTYQWYSNATNETAGSSAIDTATAATYTPPTTVAGTVYYYCVANGVTSNIVGITVNSSPVYADTSSYRLSFETNGGSAVSSITSAKGSRIDLSRYIPSREGFEFTGWYSDAGLKDKITEVRLTKNTTVYAGWHTLASQERFTLDGAYNGFDDVDESKWYGTQNEGSIRDAVRLGIVEGYGNGKFGPGDALKTSEAIKMACVVHSIYTGDRYDFTQGNPWYAVYVDYAIENGLIKAGEFADYTAVCCRSQAAYIFAKALPGSELAKISSLTPPDVEQTDAYSAEIYLLYAAGILHGNDELGTFGGDGAFTRAQAAAIITRLAMPEKRA